MPGKAKSPRVRVGERGGLYIVKNGVRRYVKRSQKGGGPGDSSYGRAPPTPIRVPLNTPSPRYSAQSPSIFEEEGGGRNYTPSTQNPPSPGRWVDSPGPASVTGPYRGGTGDYDPDIPLSSPRSPGWPLNSPTGSTTKPPDVAGTPGKGLFGGKARRKPAAQRGVAPKAKPKRKPAAKKTRRVKSR